jgi:hypothetical protein
MHVHSITCQVLCYDESPLFMCLQDTLTSIIRPVDFNAEMKNFYISLRQQSQFMDPKSGTSHLPHDLCL